MKRTYINIIISLLSLLSCNNNNLQIDVSNVNVSIKIHRFDSVLYNINSDSVINYVPDLQKNYTEFFEIFNNKIINIGEPNQLAYSGYLTKFLTDNIIVEVLEKVNAEFKEFSNYQKEIELAFKHYKYYFKEKHIPDVYTYVSGFNQSIVTTENILGIGLDKYLGENSEYYKQLGIPAYLRYKMTKSRIIPDCMTAWALQEFDYNDSIDNLLNRMIYNGKVMYFLDAVLPTYEDSVKIAYKSTQIDWCIANEKSMWTYIVENKLLFSSEFINIKKMIDDGPNTSFFPQNSPSRTGVWLGWQIVKSYMKNNPEITLPKLMNNSDYQKILNESKYKP
ncbi:MAG: hypothetical protein A2046_05460 [Bacteroidetes bacterium GWA2_30_7]|nr:MAG: hypothetical protein A2046_05460 [Bacteroidetes bacterium GWA2_30_7]